MASKNFHITPEERAYWDAMTPKSEFISHRDNFNNPHNTSYTQVGIQLNPGGTRYLSNDNLTWKLVPISSIS